jgi:hypothetical protein
MSDSNLPRIAFISQYQPGFGEKLKSPYKAETHSTQWNDPSFFSEHGGNRGNLVWMESIYKIFKYDRNKSRHISREEFVEDYKSIDENFDFVVINMACWITNNPAEVDLLPPNYFAKVKLKKCKLVCLGNGCEKHAYIKSNPNISKNDFSVRTIELLQWMVDNADIFSVRGDETKKTLKEIFNIDAISLGCPALYSFPNSINGISLPPVKDSILATTGYFQPSIGRCRASYQKAFHAFKSVNYFCQDYYRFDTPSNIEFPSHAKHSDLVDIKINEADGSVLNYPFKTDGIDKMYAPNDIDTWRGVLSMHDYYIGTRLHGAILSLQAGVFPAIFCNDERPLEVARFVGMPYLNTDIDSSFDVKNTFTKDSLNDFKNKYRMRYNQFYEALTGIGLVL